MAKGQGNFGNPEQHAEAGRRGAAAQPTEAKAKGVEAHSTKAKAKAGRNSRSGRRQSNGD